MSFSPPPPPPPPLFPLFNLSHTQLPMQCFSPDSRWLVTAAMDCTIRTWDLPSARCVDTFEPLIVVCSHIMFPGFWTVFWLRLHLLAYPSLPLENFWLQHTLMTWVCFCGEFNHSSPPIHTFSMYLFLPTLQEQPDHVLTSVSQTTPILIPTICGRPTIHTTSR